MAEENTTESLVALKSRLSKMSVEGGGKDLGLGFKSF
jgi:hypothetical protein